MAEKPELDPGLSIHWQAYCDLSTCRPAAAEGVAAIPWLAAERYARVSGFSYDQFQDLWFYVRELDEEFGRWAKEHGK